MGRLADALKSQPPLKLHSINIALNLINPAQCWVSWRWRTASNQPVPAAWVRQKPEE